MAKVNIAKIIVKSMITTHCSIQITYSFMHAHVLTLRAQSAMVRINIDSTHDIPVPHAHTDILIEYAIY